MRTVMVVASAVLFIPVLALFAYHRFSDAEDSSLAAMLMLGLTLVSAVCFGTVESDNGWSPIALAAQAAVTAAALGLHAWLQQVAARIDDAAERAESWWERRRQ